MNRRGFLKGLAGAGAVAVVAPLLELSEFPTHAEPEDEPADEPVEWETNPISFTYEWFPYSGVTVPSVPFIYYDETAEAWPSCDEPGTVMWVQTLRDRPLPPAGGRPGREPGDMVMVTA
jgi:hypothetical protein